LFLLDSRPFSIASRPDSIILFGSSNRQKS
jgi:hypothetical protein